MFNRLICDQQYIKITLFMFLLISHLIITNKVKAQSLKIQEPINYITETRNYNSALFNTFENTNYIDFAIKLSAEEPIFERFNFTRFPKEEQFYWILPGNRIVIKNEGWQSGIVSQGESLDFERREIFRLTQRLWGMQFLSSFTQGFQEVAARIDLNQFPIQSLAAELVNLEDIPVPPIQIWANFDQRETTIRTTDKIENQNWQRFYFSRPHNRTLLQYDSFVNKATYTSIYSNPGASLSFSLDKIDVEQTQTANASLGMLIGGIFELIHPPKLRQSLQEAQERFSRQENFAPLNSKATPEQRAKINQVLNTTLFLGDRTTSLEQVSGSFTFPSTITPNSSSILQIRTGNHRRAVQFIDEQFTWKEGETFISKIDISHNSFGRSTLINVPISSEQLSVIINNISLGLQTNLASLDSQEVVQEFSLDNLESDSIELTQNNQFIANFQSFNGYLYLPAIEALWAGSSGNWSYSLNSGIWFNLSADKAFNIANNFGDSESTIGVYTNGVVNYINTHLEFNGLGQIQGITSHNPALRFHWNSAVNYQNPAYINLSYSFFRQDDNRNNYSLTAGIIFFDQASYLTKSGFFEGRLELSNGLEFKTALDISDEFFYTLEGTKQVNSNWNFGGYLQNFRDINRGISSRVNDFSYGLLIKCNIPDSGIFWESRLGMSGNLFEARLEGGFRF